MLSSGEGWAPRPVQGHEYKHQPLWVEWSPADKEGQYHGHWKQETKQNKTFKVEKYRKTHLTFVWLFFDSESF